jgi:hypothetical protein
MANQSINPRAVFVVHGRHQAARNAVFDFLRAIDLLPLEWNVVVSKTGNTAPFVFDVLKCGFQVAQAVVIILTPDEEVMLRPVFGTDARLQPRPNVLFEAGMAFMHDRGRTILLDFGCPNVMSDLRGVLTLQVEEGSEQEFRIQFRQRLLDAGCPVATHGTDWLTSGNFEAVHLSNSVLEILDPTEGNNVAHIHTVRGLVRPIGRRFQVFVYSEKDEKWWLQGEPTKRNGLSWHLRCYFGMEYEQPGTRFKVVAVEGNKVRTKSVVMLPERMRSNIVDLIRM